MVNTSVNKLYTTAIISPPYFANKVAAGISSTKIDNNSQFVKFDRKSIGTQIAVTTRAQRETVGENIYVPRNYSRFPLGKEHAEYFILKLINAKLSSYQFDQC